MWWNHDIKIVISWYNDNHMMKSRWWRKAASVMWLQKIYVCMKGSKYDISEISFNVKNDEQGKIGLLNYLKLQGWDEQYDSKLHLWNLYKTSGSKWWPIIATKSWPNFSLKILTKFQPWCLEHSSASRSLPNCCKHVPHHQNQLQLQHQQVLSWHIHTLGSHQCSLLNSSQSVN